MSMTHACLAGALALAVAIAPAAPTAAQSRSASTAASPFRLTVRPHDMATGTHTAKAGVQALSGFPGYLLYVPTQCVGTTRSPLIVLLHGGGGSASVEIATFQPLADKYGVIVLLPNAEHPGHWEMVREGRLHATRTAAGVAVSPLPPMHDMQRIDSAMKLVLRQEAIDPTRVALVGFSDGGSAALLLGRSNQDVFSRVAALSALISFDGQGPQNPATQFLVSGGIAENMVARTLRMARVLRHEGHPVVTLVGLRGHVDRVEDEEFVWEWLTKSWAAPRITSHPPLPADSDPVLTVAALQQMTDFWTRFRQEPDSVLGAGRMAHQEQRWLALGSEPVSVITTDMVALAKAYSSVAADLNAAGLTAHQEAAYRAAILRVGFAVSGGITPENPAPDMAWLGQHIPVAPIAPHSVLGQNLAFRAAHRDAFAALDKVGMWTIQ